MKKKTIIAIIALMIFALSLSACSLKGQETQTGSSSQSQSAKIVSAGS